MPAPTELPLVALPAQPAGVPWPTGDWPLAKPRAEDPVPAADASELDVLLDVLFDDPAPDALDSHPLGHTHALVLHGGRIVSERYGRWFVGPLEALAGQEPAPVMPDQTHISWSMAKSVTHAMVGLLASDGRVALDERASVTQWSDPDDDRHPITWDQLLQMRPGLQWVEEYYDFGGGAALPDVVEMLWGAGHTDMAAFAAGFPLVQPPGSAEAYRYSSGTSNIVAAAAQAMIGDGEVGCRRFLSDRLFGPLGMTTADPHFDAAGTFIASSYLYASACDFARFGLLYLRDGVWQGERLLPEGWVDHGRRPRSWDETLYHGAHWWAAADRYGTFMADGFEGQRIVCVPALDLVVVRLGKTHADHASTLDAHLGAIIDLFDRGE